MIQPHPPTLATHTCSPRLSVYGRLPTHTNRTSHSNVSSLPPFTASMLTSMTPEVVRLAPVTLVFNLKSNPCFFSIRCRFLLRDHTHCDHTPETTPTTHATSKSIPTPPMLPRNSTAVTFDPNLLHTDPSSTPMTPAPIRTNRSGTASRDRAPVDDTTVRSSN